MKLASYRIAGRSTWGVIEENTAFNVGKLLSSSFPDLRSMIAAGAYDAAKQAMGEAEQSALEQIEWMPVIPNPDKILCVGLNYETHRKETGRAIVEHPTIFGRYANTQTAHLSNILRPRVSTNLDYEGELAIVIGKSGRYITRDNAMSHVAGFSCYNDGSIRDWQQHTMQFTPGKNFPETGSFGPWMMTPDELGDLAGLRIQTRLNGEVMQDAVLGQMIFDIPIIIEYCSSFNPLGPGDVIVTGTPGGVGMKRTPPVWMKPGDVVEVEIEKLGTLRNGIVAEA